MGEAWSPHEYTEVASAFRAGRLAERNRSHH